MSQPSRSYCVLGVDPGLRVTGYAVLAQPEERAEPVLLDGGVIRSPEKAPLESRLAELHHDLADIIRQHRPDVMAVENLYSHYKHPRTSIVMAHARGVILLAASQGGVAVQGYSATELKKSLVGVGRATKAQMQRMVQQRLNLDEPPEPPDLADAIAAAYCHIERALRGRGAAAGAVG